MQMQHVVAVKQAVKLGSQRGTEQASTRSAVFQGMDLESRPYLVGWDSPGFVCRKCDMGRGRACRSTEIQNSLDDAALLRPHS